MFTSPEIFISYLPETVISAIAANPEALTTPRQEAGQAAVMLADISGFTALTERLAKRGAIGAEQLNRHLNAYFRQMIDVIYRHGGDIIKFAGDAVLAMWPATREPLAIASHRAAQCSLDLLEKLSSYAVDDVRLSLHIGVGAGEVMNLHLGGINGSWEFLMAGHPLSQMAIAEEQAKSGEVCISKEGWELIKDQYQGTERQDGVVRLEKVLLPHLVRKQQVPVFSTEMIPALRSYISPGILARLDAGQSEWLSELRRVTVVFVGLPSEDELTDAAFQKMQFYTQTLQKILSQYEGSLQHLMMGDKGIVALAAFGLPPISHEDDALRGILAAQSLQSELQNRGLNPKIGITTGTVYCGIVGSEERKAYTVLGDVVNVSARLMQAADGEILCDKATYLAAKDRFEFEILQPIAVKGKTQPIPVYRPIANVSAVYGNRFAVQYEGQMVGRAKERLQLTTKLQALVENHNSSVVIISGEPGIGKSRLVEDFLENARTAGMISLFSAADAIEQSTPYYVWRKIFSLLFDLDTEDKSQLENKRQQVLEFLRQQPELLELAPLLNVVLPLELPETETTALLSGKERAEKTHVFLGQVLQISANSSPKVLVLEDAHWLDSASWTLTAQISQQVQPLLLVISMRPLSENQPQEYLQLLKSPQTQVLQLQVMDSSDTLQLICQRLGVQKLPSEVADLITKKSQGNPFFSEEIAYALRDAGLIVIDDEKCNLAPGVSNLEDLDIPDTVQGVITSRIDRLNPSMQLTLKVASVIGRAFAFQVLREIHPIKADQERLSEYLQGLDIFDLTPLMSPEPELAYIFKHIITQEVAYNLMLFSQRQELHQRVGEWFERRYGSEISEYYETLAYHYEQAQVWQKALKYLLKAAQKAQQAYVNPEALSHYNRALAVCEQLENAVEGETLMTIYAGVGQVHFLLSEFEASITAYQKMLEVALSVEDRHKQAEALYNIGYGFFWAHEFEKALDYAQQAYALALEIDYKNMQVASRFVMGYIYGVTAKLDDSMGCFSEGINIAQQIGDKTQEGLNTFLLGLVNNWKGEYERALQLGDHGVLIGEVYNIQLAWMMNLWGRGISRCGTGNYNGSFADLETAMMLSERLGDKVWKSRILNTLGWWYSELYNVDLAIQYNYEGFNLALKLGDPEIIRNAAINLGDCYLLKGDLPTAESTLIMVYRDSQQYGKWGEEWMKWRYLQHCCHSLGEVHLLQGKADLAMALAEECVRLAEGTITRKNMVKGWRLMGQALLAQGNIKEAQKFLKKAITLAEELGNPAQLWKTYDVVGDFYLHCGQVEEAMSAYRCALQVIEETASQLQNAEVKNIFMAAIAVQKIKKKVNNVVVF